MLITVPNRNQFVIMSLRLCKNVYVTTGNTAENIYLDPQGCRACIPKPAVNSVGQTSVYNTASLGCSILLLFLMLFKFSRNKITENMSSDNIWCYRLLSYSPTSCNLNSMYFCTTGMLYILKHLCLIGMAICIVKGTVQRKLTWVKSGINRRLMIWAWAAWGLFYILRVLGP
jgi:hypothetical protein